MKIEVLQGTRRTSRRLSLLFVLGAAFLSPFGVHAQTVDEVIAKNIQAHGGMEKLKSVKTIRATGKLTQGSFRAGFLQENKRPGKVREEAIIQGLTQIQAYDGKTGWQVSPFGGRKDAELLSQDDLKGLTIDADIDGPLVDYQEKGHQAELVGHDSVEGTDCYKVKLTLKNGDVRYYFLDTDSFLEIKMENQSNIRGAVQFTENFYGDYEQVDGLFFPFAFENGEKGNPNRTKYTVEKIEVNVPLDEGLFSMPVSKSEGKAAGEAKPPTGPR
ncbi:MAG: outer membrane lipoprotein-sorting protein [Acidobacteriota bacterium]|nr:outer membrane lipoprotein-sorting protein [Acidobacteriota bacterium]